MFIKLCNYIIFKKEKNLLKNFLCNYIIFKKEKILLLKKFIFQVLLFIQSRL